MAGGFLATGVTFSNLSRLELEQLRKADFFAGSKGLTVGDDGSGIDLGPGNINAEPYLTGPTVLLDDVYSLTPPTNPGEALGTTTQTEDLTAETSKWYGPTRVFTGSAGVVTAPGTTATFTDLTTNFTTDGVLAGDILLIKSTPTFVANKYAVATVTVVGTTTITVSSINNTFAGGGTSLLVDGGTYAYVIIRPNAIQLFAVPGSGATGFEQSFLAVIPGSALHSNVAPTLNQINADRIKSLIPGQYGLDTSVDRADAVFTSPGPRTSLDKLGYRIVLYPDNGAGTGPNLATPIATLTPIIDPGVPPTDQRFTVDLKAGVIRFSTEPKIGGQIKVAGGTNATTGRLNLYAVYWAVDQTLTKGSARYLFASRSTNDVAAANPLTGTFSVTATMTSVTASLSQTGLLFPNNVVTFASQPGVPYVIATVAGTAITLTTAYTGTTNAATGAVYGTTSGGSRLYWDGTGWSHGTYNAITQSGAAVGADDILRLYDAQTITNATNNGGKYIPLTSTDTTDGAKIERILDLGWGQNSTTVGFASNNQILPQSTINVGNTASFEVADSIMVTTSNGPQLVTYTGLTPTSFTGCAGGTGTMLTGNAVTAVAQSLLRNLNTRYYCVIGDGVSSYGDWNGANALNAALSFIQTNSITSAVIRLKAGTHTINASLDVGGGGASQISIEGYGSGNLAAGSVIGAPPALAGAVANVNSLVAGNTAAVPSLGSFPIANITGLAGMTNDYVGKQITFTGAATSTNNGTFVITAILSSSSVQIRNPMAFAPDANNGAIVWDMHASVLTGLNAIPTTVVGTPITVSGAATAGNNGTFAIISRVSSTSVVIANASGVAPDANNGALSWTVNQDTIYVHNHTTLYLKGVRVTSQGGTGVSSVRVTDTGRCYADECVLDNVISRQVTGLNPVIGWVAVGLRRCTFFGTNEAALTIEAGNGTGCQLVSVDESTFQMTPPTCPAIRFRALAGPGVASPWPAFGTQPAAIEGLRVTKSKFFLQPTMNAGQDMGTTASVTAFVSPHATITGLTGMDPSFVGQTLTFSAAASGGNNGTFTIFAVISPTTVQITNGAAVAPDANNGTIHWALNSFTNGNFLNNTGLVDIDPNGQEARIFNGATVQECSFTECVVSTFQNPGPTFNVVLHMVPWGNGKIGAATGPYMQIQHFAMRSVRITNLFGDGGPLSQLCPISVADGAVHFEMNDVTVTELVVPTSGGTLIPDDNAFTYTGTNTVPATLLYGALAISCAKVTAKKIVMNGMPQLSTSGDLSIRTQDIDVDDIELSNWASVFGPFGAVPVTRVIFSGYGTTSSGFVKNVKLDGQVATVAAPTWTLVSFVTFWNWSTSTDKHIEITGGRITNFQDFGSSFAAAMGVQFAASSNLRNIEINDYFIRQCRDGIVASATNVFDFAVRRCNCSQLGSSPTGVGISVYGDNIGDVRVTDNVALANGGIGIVVGNSSGGGGSWLGGIWFTNNDAYNNNTAAPSPQIVLDFGLVATNAPTATPFATFAQGNNCTDGGGVAGWMQLLNHTGPIAPNDTSLLSKLRGWQTIAGTAVYNYTTLTTMFFNNANLKIG